MKYSKPELIELSRGDEVVRARGLCESGSSTAGGRNDHCYDGGYAMGSNAECVSGSSADTWCDPMGTTAGKGCYTGSADVS